MFFLLVLIELLFSNRREKKKEKKKESDLEHGVLLFPPLWRQPSHIGQKENAKVERHLTQLHKSILIF